MNPYKMKHVPAGLYFQPPKHNESHLSKTGKIYQTKVNGVSSRCGDNKVCWISCKKDSTTYKLTKDIIDWKEDYVRNELYISTNFEDWIIEEI